MAYKVFSNGDALTGSEMNTYLMNQAVISFASITARDAALPSPSEGQLVWLEDSNKYVYYTGSAWSDLITPASSGNAIINGAFDIWQRGTSFSPASSVETYTADRWAVQAIGFSSRTVTRETFTPGTAPVAGYEGSYFARFTGAGGDSSSRVEFLQKVEDVRTFANQNVTISFWAKGDSARTAKVSPYQVFGSGGSGNVAITGQTFAVTSSWQRFTLTFSVPSISGKTIGTGSSLLFYIGYATGAASGAAVLDLWGVQLEAGSTATAFKRNASNIQGELAACQRYYWRAGGDDLYQPYGSGIANGSTSANIVIYHPVTMRTAPTSMDFSNLGITDEVSIQSAISGLTLGSKSKMAVTVQASGASGLTATRVVKLSAQNSLSAYLGMNAEL